MRLRRRISVLFLLTLFPAALAADCRAFSGSFQVERDAQGRLAGTGSLTVAGEASPIAGRVTFADFAPGADSTLSTTVTQELRGSNRRAAGSARLTLRRSADGSSYEIRGSVPLTDGPRRGETVLEGTIDLALSGSTLAAHGSLCD